ncbi:MAG: hypothetical protein EXQ52_07855 [Bryobacterales bacterium]|nr:hypothetical protein [Bryobacterales bacterium]
MPEAGDQPVITAVTSSINLFFDRPRCGVVGLAAGVKNPSLPKIDPPGGWSGFEAVGAEVLGRVP